MMTDHTDGGEGGEVTSWDGTVCSLVEPRVDPKLSLSRLDHWFRFTVRSR